MSYEAGQAVLNLEKLPYVPRTEYSAEGHWDLVSRVTGIPVTVESPADVKSKAQAAFVGPMGWDYSFFWNTLIGAGEFPEYHTSMGHAVYAAGGVDFDTNIHSPFKEPEDVLAFDPLEKLGPRDPKELKRRFEDHYAAACRARPGGVNMSGVYITCVSGLLDLFGWDLLLLAMGTDAVKFGKLTNRYAQWIQQYFDALAASNVPVVMIHDDMVWTEGAIFPPAWYKEYVFPNYKRYMKPLRDSGKKIMFTSDGNYTAFIDDIAACGVHGFVMEPTTDMKYIAEKYGKTHVFIGNADTRILLSGPKPAIRAEVERCMAIGKPCNGFMMAVGNHIPPNTPVEHALYYDEVYRALRRR